MGRAHGRLLRWDEIEQEHGILRNTLKSWVRRGHQSCRPRSSEHPTWLGHSPSPGRSRRMLPLRAFPKARLA